MGRRSNLTDTQWNEIEKRVLSGEPLRSIGKHFGISEAAIRKRLGAQTKQIKAVANQIVEVEGALKSLPIGAQISALNLADELRAISTHLASAAKYGAATAHRLFGIAHEKAMMVNDATPMEGESLDSLKGIAVLTRMGNESANLGMNLINANKETVKRISEEDSMPPLEGVEVVIVDASSRGK